MLKPRVLPDKKKQAVNLKGFHASMNPWFHGGFPDFMDGIQDFMDNPKLKSINSMLENILTLDL